ncbi:MAG: signal peptidase I [Patescibacteria group bacterium]
MAMTDEYLDNGEKKSGGFFKELLKFILIAFLVVVPFRYFVAQPFIVNGASMTPTFLPGEYLIVDQISYKTLKDPERGEIIIFHYPKDRSKYFIKRIIGLPSETVRINGTEITIINEANPKGLKLKEDYILYPKNDSMEVTLEDDEYFVMGDNRASSSDSRVWGPLKEDLIVGRPLVRLIPFSRLKVFPGRYEE